MRFQWAIVLTLTLGAGCSPSFSNALSGNGAFGSRADGATAGAPPAPTITIAATGRRKLRCQLGWAGRHTGPDHPAKRRAARAGDCRGGRPPECHRSLIAHSRGSGAGRPGFRLRRYDPLRAAAVRHALRPAQGKWRSGAGPCRLPVRDKSSAAAYSNGARDRRRRPADLERRADRRRGPGGATRPDREHRSARSGRGRASSGRPGAARQARGQFRAGSCAAEDDPELPSPPLPVPAVRRGRAGPAGAAAITLMPR